MKIEMYRYEQALKEIMNSYQLRKKYEAATDDEKLEMICESAFDLGWDAAIENRPYQNWCE